MSLSVKYPTSPSLPPSHLLLAVWSLAGKFTQRLTVTTRAFLSKQYLAVHCSLPKPECLSAETCEAFLCWLSINSKPELDLLNDAEASC